MNFIDRMKKWAGLQPPFQNNTPLPDGKVIDAFKTDRLCAFLIDGNGRVYNLAGGGTFVGFTILYQPQGRTCINKAMEELGVIDMEDVA